MSGLKAGRELDALVATKVMGIDLTERPTHTWEPLVDSGEYVDAKWCEHCGHCWFSGEAPGGPCAPTPLHYSSEIAFAWEVVEKLATRFPTIHISLGAPNQRWYCSFFASKDDKGSALEADTAPLAICLAALKAVGHEPAEPAPTPDSEESRPPR